MAASGIIFGAESEFVVGAVSYNSVAALNVSKFVVAYQDESDGNHGTAKIGTVSGTDITFGDETEFLSVGAAIRVDVAVLSESGFVVAYRDVADSNHGTAKIGTVSGTTITFGAESEFLVGSAEDISVSAFSESGFIVVYRDAADSNHGTAKIGTVSGTTITFGSETEFLSVNGADYIDVEVLSSSGFVVAFRDFSDSSHGTAKFGTISGTTITFGSETEYVSSDAGFYNSLVPIDASTFIIAYRAGTTFNAARFGTVSGTTLSFGLQSKFLDPGMANFLSAVGMSPSEFVLTYGDSTDLEHGTAQIGIVSGTTITYDGETEFSSSGTITHTNTTALDSSRFVVVYRDDADSGHGTAKIGTLLSEISTSGTTSGNITLFTQGYESYQVSGDLYISGPQITSGLNTSGDLFIHGRDNTLSSGNLYTNGLESYQASNDLFIKSYVNIQISGDLYISGPQITSGLNTSGDLFIHGRDNTLSSGNLYTNGLESYQASNDLFIKSYVNIQISGDLYISGPQITSGLSNHNTVLFINGFESKPALICPALDPTAAIQIKDSLITTYQIHIDALINQLGKNVYLEFDPILSPCPNCWTSGVIISTPSGPRQIQDINVGDEVFSPNGNIRRVRGKFISEYEGRLFNINCWGINVPESMTAKHRLPIVRNIRKLYTQKQWYDANYILTDPPIELIEAQNIQSGDALILPSSPHNENDLKSIDIDGFGIIDCSDNLLIFLGWWLAEGCVHKSVYPRESSLCLCASKEEAIANSLINIVKDIFGVIGKKEFRSNADNLLIHFRSVKLTSFLMKFGLGAWNKAIPSDLWSQLSKRQLSVIFDAYRKGDGNIFNDLQNAIYNRYSISTTSKILAFQIFDYLTQEGLSPSINHRKARIDKNKVNHRENWEVLWLPYRREQKSNVRNSNIGQLAIVRNIKQTTQKTMVYNLDIDIDHQYVVNGIASENCTYDTIRKRSTGIYIPGGPRPFKRGRRCPYCKGKGLLETAVNKCIKCLLQWNPSDAVNFGIAISQKKGIVRLKTYLTEADDLTRARTVIVNHDIVSQMKLRVKLIQGPIPVGLREDRYCISFWELI